MQQATQTIVTPFSKFWRVRNADGGFSFFNGNMSYADVVAKGSDPSPTIIMGYGVVEVGDGNEKVVKVSSDRMEAVKEAVTAPEKVVKVSKKAKKDVALAEEDKDTVNGDRPFAEEPVGEADQRASGEPTGENVDASEGDASVV